MLLNVFKRGLMPQFVIQCLATACWVFAGTAFAQQAPSPTSSPTLPAQDAASSTVYRSAWSGYRPFADEKVISWKDANDEVLRIGGWRAYLRESQSGDDTPRTAPAIKGSAKKPSSDSGAAHRHGLHHPSKESR